MIAVDSHVRMTWSNAAGEYTVIMVPNGSTMDGVGRQVRSRRAASSPRRGKGSTEKMTSTGTSKYWARRSAR